MPTIKKSQRGAIAIMVGLTLVILVGMLAMVVDLGHDYLVKTGLQNGADAAALAGAKELNGKATGVAAATQKAIEVARQNGYVFSNPVGTSDADGGLDLSVGSCPDDGCMVPIANVTSDALAADKTFLKVDTRPRSLATWFAGIFTISQLQTFGMAVAGKYAIQIVPIAICRLPDPGTANELGYERGVSYKVSDANPVGPGTMYWIDPSSNAPGVCPTTSTNATLPYVCGGVVSFTPTIGGTVNTNTGISTPQMDAVDSRFGVYASAGKCDPAMAPPDTNVKQYIYSNPAGSGSPRDWMATDPVQQSITFGTYGGVWKQKPYALRSIADYGVLWSAYRPINATTSQWATLYGEAAATYPAPPDSYPGSSPYAQTATSGNPEYFQAPPVAYGPGKPGQRKINMVIVDCKTLGGVCRPATVLGIGKFFIQRQYVLTGSLGHEMHLEFGGLTQTPFPPSDIRLYR